MCVERAGASGNIGEMMLLKHEGDNWPRRIINLWPSGGAGAQDGERQTLR